MLIGFSAGLSIMVEKLITVGNFDEPMEAHIAKARLDAQGIRCFLSGEFFVGTYWLLSKADGGVKLKVKLSDADRAREILTPKRQVVQDKAEEPAGTGQRDEDSSGPVCPKCGSDLVEYEKYSRKMFFLGILLLKIPVPFPKDSYRCLDCGHVWSRRQK